MHEGWKEIHAVDGNIAGRNDGTDWFAAAYEVALEAAKLPFCITHSPGCMLVTDLKNSDLAVVSD